MEKQDLFELMDRFARSGLQRMALQDGDFTLELEKPVPVMAVPAAAPVAAAAPAAVEAPAVDNALYVKAPLVGTYYAASSPDAAPYVRVGDRVEKGQTLCLIEAMKTMNEIPAPCDLLVEEILVDNGALVAFDAPILRYSHV
ncbi:acetyl-CoA carboxylase biotin carboxyl carrier protein [Candidatus Avoscillospira sp. LCP25S3_F1]|uniref:acetyl-CoA carboxylase biotin carboxyl carrier protein n=1 Tax=Candidatus Avoscillospira sp. LCP25S3_F1 TaxID=3438825 RepID=UPI003F921AE4